MSESSEGRRTRHTFTQYSAGYPRFFPVSSNTSTRETITHACFTTSVITLGSSRIPKILTNVVVEDLSSLQSIILAWAVTCSKTPPSIALPRNLAWKN